MKIENIADLSPGLVITRKKSRNSDDVVATYKLLNLNAVNDRFGTIDENLLSDFNSREELEEHYFTKEGDILVRLNEPFTAIYIGKDEENILIPSYFIKLKINKEVYNPWYLIWYLNSNNIKREFLRNQSNTLIPSINQKIVKNLKIPEISKIKQDNIAELYRLHIEEMMILNRLIDLKFEEFKGYTDILLKEFR